MENSHAEQGWVDLDSTSNPNSTGGSATISVNGSSVPRRYRYLRAIGGNATINMINLLTDSTIRESPQDGVTLYEGFPEPVLVKDSDLEIVSGDVRAYYAPVDYYDYD